jgi:uncharacterized protein YbaR (Trm112 family)
MIDPRLLEVLVCPVSKAPLIWRRDRNELWCRQSELAYPVIDDVPHMVEGEARQLSEDELATLERA